VTIRDGTADDRARAFAIWRAGIAATHGFLAPDHKARFTGIVEDMLATTPFTVVADKAGQVQGFMVFVDGSIEALFVDPAVHGRGFGSTLVDQALSIDPQACVDANEQADNALPFYEARGFVQVGRSERDAEGLPYPIIHLRHPGPEASIT
jgi:putative acetyltransferase